jgi:capsular exopolysaccharide synthesis family protein
LSNPRSIVLVTSALPGEGKTLVTFNLALTAALDGEGSVLLVDADLRRPTVHSFLRPSPERGLTDVVADRTQLSETVVPLIGGRLHVLTSGKPPSNPVAVAQSQQMSAVLAQARDEYNLVIMDTPPVLGLTDADILSRKADGTLLVARAGRCTPTVLQRALGEMTAVDILGVVYNDAGFNFADIGRHGRRYYSKYYSR